MLKVEFQQGAKAEGIDYELDCIKALKGYGFSITATKVRLEGCGVEIDIVATNRHGLHALIECKGGREVGKKVGGFKSSDNVRKAIASAASLWFGQSQYTEYPYTPLIILTTYIMAMGSEPFNQVSVLPTYVMADVLCDRDAAGIKYWAELDMLGLEAHKKTFETVGDVLLANRYWNLKGR